MSGQQVSSADPGTAELMLDVDGANAARAFGACFSGVVVNVRESAAKSLPNRRRKTPENGGKRRRTAETAGTQHGMHPNTLRSCNSHDVATRNVGSGDAPWIPTLLIESYILQVLSCFVLRVCLLHPTFSPSMEATRMSYVLGNSGTQYSAPLPHPWLPEIIFLREPTL